jgi:hypothetical protein
MSQQIDSPEVLAEALKALGGVFVAGAILKLTRLWAALQTRRAIPWIAAIALGAALAALFPFPRPEIKVKAALIGRHGPLLPNDADWFEDTCKVLDKTINDQCWMNVERTEQYKICTVSNILVDPAVVETGFVCQLHSQGENMPWAIEVKGSGRCKLTCFDIEATK